MRRGDGLKRAGKLKTRLGNSTFQTGKREKEIDRKRERKGGGLLTIVSPGVNLLVLGYSLQKGQSIVWAVGRAEGNPRTAVQHAGAVQTRAVTATW